MKKNILALAGLFIIILTPLIAAAADSDQPSSTEAAFVASDRDRSGSISLQEFSSYVIDAEGTSRSTLSRDFSLMDLDKDNQLSLEELEVGEELKPQNFQ